MADTSLSQITNPAPATASPADSSLVYLSVEDTGGDRQDYKMTLSALKVWLGVGTSTTYKGEWVANTAYSKGNIVFSNSNAYIAEADVNSSTRPENDTTNWSLLTGTAAVSIPNDSVDTTKIKFSGSETSGNLFTFGGTGNSVNLVAPPAANRYVPTGGSIHYALIKASNTNNDVEWDLIRTNSLAGSSVTEIKLADNAVSLAKMKHGTANKYIGYNASGVPAELDLPAAPTVTSLGLGDAVISATISGNVITFNQKDGTSFTITVPSNGGGGGVTNLGDLGNVHESNQVNGQVLTWDNGDSRWENKSLPAYPTVTSLGLGDSFINASFASNTLTFTQKDNTTVTVDLSSLGGGTSITGIGAIPDVNITTVAAGNVLQYVAGTTNEWQNKAPSWLPLTGGTLNEAGAATVLLLQRTQVSGEPIVKIRTDATGSRKAFQATNNGQNTAWLSMEWVNQQYPGIAFGTGAATRDVQLYRREANHLYTPDKLTIGELAVLSAGAGASRTSLGLATAFVSATYSNGTFTVTKADGNTDTFSISTGNSSIADDSVTLAKLAPGTAGKVIGFDSSGDPAELDLPSNIGAVHVSNQTNGQVLTWDNGDSRWENKSLPAYPTVTSLGLGDSFTDVTISGQVITFTQKDGTTDKTITIPSNGGGGTSITALNDIPGVNITSVAAGNVLQYVAGTDNEWQNVAPSWLPLTGGTLAKTASGTMLTVSGVNSGNSTIIEIISPISGDQKAFGAKTSGQGLDWVQFAKGIGGANKPGLALGTGSSGRDTNIYREAANHLRTDDKFTVHELAVDGGATELSNTRTSLGLGTAFTSAIISGQTLTVTKANGTTEAFTVTIADDAVKQPQLDISGTLTEGYLLALGSTTSGETTYNQFTLVDPSTLGGGGDIDDYSLTNVKFRTASVDSRVVEDYSLQATDLASPELRGLDAHSEFFETESKEILNITLGTTSPSNEFYTRDYLSAGPHGSADINDYTYIQALGNNYMAIPRSVYEEHGGAIAKLYYSGVQYNISSVRINTFHPGWTNGYKTVNGKEFVALRFNGITSALFSNKTISGGTNFAVTTSSTQRQWANTEIAEDGDSSVRGVVDVGTTRFISYYQADNSAGRCRAYNLSTKVRANAFDLTFNYGESAHVGQLTKSHNNNYIRMVNRYSGRVDAYNVPQTNGSGGDLNTEQSFALHNSHSNASGIDEDFRYIFVGEHDFSRFPRVWAYSVSDLGARVADEDIVISMVQGQVGRIAAIWNNGAIRWVAVEIKNDDVTNNDNLNVTVYGFNAFSGEHDSNHDFTLVDPEIADMYGDSDTQVILTTERTINEYAYSGAAAASNSRGEFALLKSTGDKIPFDVIRDEFVELDEDVRVRSYLQADPRFNLSQITQPGFYHITKRIDYAGVPQEVENDTNFAGRLYVVEEKEGGFEEGPQGDLYGKWTTSPNQLLVTGGVKEYAVGDTEVDIHKSNTSLRVDDIDIPFAVRFKSSEVALTYPDSYKNLLPPEMKVTFCYTECGDAFRVAGLETAADGDTGSLSIGISAGYIWAEDTDPTHTFAHFQVRNSSTAVLYLRQNVGDIASIVLVSRTFSTSNTPTTTEVEISIDGWNNQALAAGGITYYRFRLDRTSLSFINMTDFDFKIKYANGSFFKGPGAINTVHNSVVFDNSSATETIDWKLNGQPATTLYKETAGVPPTISMSNGILGLLDISRNGSAGNVISFGKVVDANGIRQVIEADDGARYERFDPKSFVGGNIAPSWKQTKKPVNPSDNFFFSQGYTLPSSSGRTVGALFVLLKNYVHFGTPLVAGLYVCGVNESSDPPDLGWKRVFLNNIAPSQFTDPPPVPYVDRIPANPSNGDQVFLIETYDYEYTTPVLVAGRSGQRSGYSSGKINSEPLTFGSLTPNADFRIPLIETVDHFEYLSLIYLRIISGTFPPANLTNDEVTKPKLHIYEDDDLTNPPGQTYRMKYVSSGDYNSGPTGNPSNAQYRRFELYYDTEFQDYPALNEVFEAGRRYRIGISYLHSSGERREVFPNKTYRRGLWTYSTTDGWEFTASS